MRLRKQAGQQDGEMLSRVLGGSESQTGIQGAGAGILVKKPRRLSETPEGLRPWS